jgi:transposase
VIGSTRQVTVYAYGAPVDMRKGFDGLSALVTNDLNHDPLAGDFFVFVNHTRKRAKVLLWDGTGLCIYAKRLEQGRFACLWRDPPSATAPLRLTLSELQLFLEGSALVGRMPLSPTPFVLTAARRWPNSLGTSARA